MAEDNLSRQADEIEALSAIYNEEWCVVDLEHRIYCIQISDARKGNAPKYSVRLEVTLPLDYPSESPPSYQLNAPWLRGDERLEICNALEDIFCANIGESIIYLWVEAIREFVVKKAINSKPGGACSDKDSKNANMSKKKSPGGSKTKSEQTNAEATAEPERDARTSLPLQAQAGANLPQTEQAFQCPEIYHGELVKDRRSTFQAHLASVKRIEEVDMVMSSLLENKKIASATHNIIAYRIQTREHPTPLFMHGCADDGETHAGSRMLHLLEIVDARDVIVIVTRWYGGVHLGPDRFKHINNCTRQILLDHGYIKEKEDKKKKGKK